MEIYWCYVRHVSVAAASRSERGRSCVLPAPIPLRLGGLVVRRLPEVVTVTAAAAVVVVVVVVARLLA